MWRLHPSMSDADTSRSRIATFTGDPLRLRRYGYALAGALALASGTAHGFLSGVGGQLTFDLAWIMLPLPALAIGAGEAFFLRAGRNRRRVLLQTTAAVALAMGACVWLSLVPKKSQMWPGNMLDTIGYATVYLTGLLTLAGLLAFGIGLGEGYLARRVAELSQEDW